MQCSRALWAPLLAVCACARLPQIEAGECGNGVIEEPEDCDGFASESGAQCRSAGSVGECRLDCSSASNGARPECPAGWGCDENGICRRPTGEFESRRELEVGSATSLLAGDFDGDQHWDIASLEPFEGAGVTRLRFHYFDERAQLADTRTFPLRMIAPVSADVTGDARSDILFSDGRIGLLRGRGDRSWVPDTFSSYRIANSSLRITSVSSGLVENTSGFVVFARFADRDGMYVADQNVTGMPRLLAGLTGSVENLLGDPIGARVFEDESVYPCMQSLLALSEESRFWVYDSCTTKPDVVGPAWREQAEQHSVELDPPAPVDAPPQVADLNADGHADVLLGAGGLSYVSYGDGQTLAVAVPYVLETANALPEVPTGPLPTPLAVADVTGDGAPDFVFPAGVLLSSPAARGSGFDYAPFAPHVPGYWTRALAADLNGNGKLDFIAASAGHPSVDFFNGTGTRFMTDFSIPTNRPVQHLVAGDFDGDQIQDLALTQISAASGLADSLFIAFGSVQGPPERPSAVAQLGEITQIATWREGALDHIGMTSREADGESSRAALALLASNGDRIPVASYELTTFAEDGSTDGSIALRATQGAFLGPEHRDVLALAFRRGENGNPDLTVGLVPWLMPSLASDGTPSRLEAAFDPELVPLGGEDPNSQVRVSVHAVDVDGDGRDEAALAMPRADGLRCSVLLFGVDLERLEPRADWTIDEACPQVELGSFDADADGAADILLRTGDGSAGSLSVFWNDGSGGFAAPRRSVLTDAAPRAFAALEGNGARPLSIAYVTQDGLFLVAATQQAREFELPGPPLASGDCTGLVAADVNGDAATDLAYAANGNITVLEAVLESR